MCLNSYLYTWMTIWFGCNFTRFVVCLQSWSLKYKHGPWGHTHTMDHVTSMTIQGWGQCLRWPQPKMILSTSRKKGWRLCCDSLMDWGLKETCFLSVVIIVLRLEKPFGKEVKYPHKLHKVQLLNWINPGITVIWMIENLNRHEK